MDKARSTRFEDHFTIALCEDVLKMEASDDRKKGDAIAFAMDLVTTKFLKALQAECALPPIDGTKGHRMRFADAWNRAATGEGSDADWADVAGRFGYRIALEGIFVGKDKPLPTAAEAHAKICAYADRGLFHGIEAGHSAVDDRTVYLRIDDWVATAVSYGRDNKPTPLEDAIDVAFQAARITFPTGKLLIGDWFRIDAFTKALREPDGMPSLSSDQGRVDMTLHVLSKGVASFHVGNTSPDVFLRDGAIIIGEQRDLFEHDWDSDAAEPGEAQVEGRLGRVCTDLWNATIVDEATLLAILASELGSDEAAAEAYAAYRKTTHDIILEATVKPGTYEVHFGPRHDAFAKAFRDDRAPALAEIAAYGALIPVAA